MRYAFGFLLTVFCFSMPLVGERNSQRFLIPTNIRINDIQIPHGTCEVTWTEPSGSQVQLTIKTIGRSPITLPARVVRVKHPDFGITTFFDRGVTYLQDFHTPGETFILIGTPGPR